MNEDCDAFLQTANSSLVLAPVDGGPQSASFSAAIVNSAHDAIVGMTSEGIVTSRNGGAECIYDYSANEVLDRHACVIVPGDHQIVDELFERIADDGVVEHIETQRMCNIEKTPDFAVTLSPIFSENGAAIGASVVGQNTAELVSTERERTVLATPLDQSEQLASFGEFAGRIAHDFNNLLGVILSYASLIADELEDEDAIKADVEQIRTAVMLARELTRQLVAFET